MVGMSWLDNQSVRSMQLSRLDPLEFWVEVSPPTLGIDGVEPPTRRVEEGPTTPWLKGGPAAFQLGLCEQSCVNILGKYNSGFTSIFIASEKFDGFLQERSSICLSLNQSSTVSTLPSILKSSSVSGSRSGRDWSSWQG